MINYFDGAWRARYAAALWGEGLVVLRAGKFLGCDQQFFYDGEYSVSDDGRFAGKVHVKHYAGDERDIFQRTDGGPRLVEYSADIEGRIEGNVLRLVGTVMHHDGLSPFPIVLTRVLP